MNGYGEFIWKDSKKYFGFYKNDKKEGFGIFYWEKSKKIYVGFFQNGKQDGIGMMIGEGKPYKYGYWKDGQKIKSYNSLEEALSVLQKNKQSFRNYFMSTYEKIVEFLLN
jgi:hypothetical protein